MAKKTRAKYGAWREEFFADVIQRATDLGQKKWNRNKIWAFIESRSESARPPHRKHYKRAVGMSEMGKKKLMTALEKQWPGHRAKKKRVNQPEKKKHPADPPEPPKAESIFCSAIKGGCGKPVKECICHLDDVNCKACADSKRNSKSNLCICASGKNRFEYGTRAAMIKELKACGVTENSDGKIDSQPKAVLQGMVEKQRQIAEGTYEEEGEANSPDTQSPPPPPPPPGCAHENTVSSLGPDDERVTICTACGEQWREKQEEVVESAPPDSPSAPLPPPPPPGAPMIAPPPPPPNAMAVSLQETFEEMVEEKPLVVPVPPPPPAKTYSPPQPPPPPDYQPHNNKPTHRVCFSAQLDKSREETVVVEELNRYLVGETGFGARVTDGARLGNGGIDLKVEYTVHITEAYEVLLDHPWVVDLAAKPAADFGEIGPA